MSEAWQSEYVTVEGVELGVCRTGRTNPPIVLVHGITDSGLCWTRLARALEARWDVIMVDARGHGQSAHPRSYSFAEHVRDLTGVLDALDLQEPVLVGHSMGGPHVAAVAAALPDRVRAVVLVDPHWSLNAEDPVVYDLPAWQAGIAADNRRSLQDLLDIGRKDNPAWAEEDLQPWARAKQVVDPKVPTWLHSTVDLDSWPMIVSRIRCPALLVTGDPSVDENVTVRPEGADKARLLCPTLTVAHIPGAGHSIHRDQYGPFLAAVTNFLDGHLE